MLAVLGHSTQDHVAFQVRTGMLSGAVWFFREIGWFELHGRKVSGPWGQARFFTSDLDSPVVQLTELSGGSDSLVMTENHLAVHFSRATPEEAAKAILAWATYACAGEDASIEKANPEGTKWFVYLPALFTFAIEIV
ncbi:MAG: hypothetical protein UW64_C0002G0084 [Microgenomates group bacterium GW2011_GWC1_44_37]|uniref:Uncharacterized protein n=1 Tax=Candidatus Collierbacteria bacterium GW2011_GWB2_44_22 TaxID=1618387 RepID=A0A0G1I0S0_9BACT|nr:MAG: hypothetical protein UW31_C0004G0010 [Candidatus Collierbacteria bacterium GW2011_GWA2_44_13]KKT51412.1 MAG: hypothetical protein UW42_C0003G0025 [Candidatus Collierbacteria bacterium GW2011_GWB1_44_197]KKT52418.1 MAG: hypothetical protein UW44_C0002G0084 [Candidatus Collierbacteria bacterium GW2011_GWB2_44_22]KKT62870.1 MAG: hypothetical protein UW56_C0003G0056 [Candidatus Collierbacteria bacterium GW2011_GWD1_44_27]KKT66269.1 MAG: hypothetical protein UW58_C0011G0040 [Candidatus Colli